MTTTVTQTVTCTPTGTGNQTSATETLLCYQQSTISSSSSSTAQLYQLEFLQESNCPYGSWLFPWAVVLNNSTMVVQPSNATLPLSYSSTHLTSNGNYSTIWFSVPDGTYNYAVLPSNFYGTEQSGTVTIAGSNAIIEVTAFATAMGCSSTTTSG